MSKQSLSSEHDQLTWLIQYVGRLENALGRIAAPMRPDGTYNLCREACEQIARDALRGNQMNEEEALAFKLYEQSGGDPSRCEFCDQPLGDDRPYRHSLDGAGAHEDCLRSKGIILER